MSNKTKIIQLDNTSAYWRAYLEHAARHDMRQWIVDETDLPLDNSHYLGAILGDVVIGHLTLKQQPIMIPATEWAGDRETVVADATRQPLQELFVQTFAVDETYRRQRIGSRLQEAGLKLARTLGCYQVRSWSSLDRLANYQLKIKLGFAIHPSVYTTPSGLEVSGIFFVKTVL
jgi:GNAT superfamily N-acetyltransferase